HRSTSGAEEKQYDTLAKRYGISRQLIAQFKGASSSIEDGGISFDIGFMFDSAQGRLRNVLVGKSGCDESEATRIKIGLTSRYGTPFEDYHFYDLLTTAKWRAGGELIVFSITKEKDSKLLSCLISYEPIP